MRAHLCIATATAVAGLASHALAAVTEPSFVLEGVTNLDQFNLNGDSLGNESFIASGGVEVLPFFQIATGDDIFSFLTFASNTASGQLSPSGAFEFNTSLSARGDSFFDLGAFSATARSPVSFSVATPSAFTLSGQTSILEFAGARVELASTSGEVVFAREGFGFDEVRVYDESGVLAPGDYTLIVESSIDLNSAASPDADTSISFNVVPTPAGAALLSLAGAVAARRRR